VLERGNHYLDIPVSGTVKIWVGCRFNHLKADTDDLLFSTYSVEKLFQHRFKQNFWGHQTPNQAAFVDCRAFYEVSVFEAVILELPKRVFQQI
jgi:hypothetical protein